MTERATGWGAGEIYRRVRGGRLDGEGLEANGEGTGLGVFTAAGRLGEEEAEGVEGGGGAGGGWVFDAGELDVV